MPQLNKTSHASTSENPIAGAQASVVDLGSTHQRRVHVDHVEGVVYRSPTSSQISVRRRASQR